MKAILVCVLGPKQQPKHTFGSFKTELFSYHLLQSKNDRANLPAIRCLYGYSMLQRQKVD